MNDDDLQQKLRAFAAPAPGDTDTARERARHRALIAFSQPGEAAAPKPRRALPGWAAAGALATLVLAGVWFRPQPPAPAGGPGDAAVLAQVGQLFPGRLVAVIEHGGEVKVALAREDRAASDQPLLVEFRRGDSLVRVFSYSGSHVCVDLGGRQACFDALIGGHGQVIVAGEDFVWTAQNGASADGWQITAKSLGGAS
jgi:hypothetical protein